MASKHGYEDVVKVLLENWAEVQTVDNNGQTALHIAVLSVFGLERKVVSLLLDYGAVIEATDHDGKTAQDLVSRRDFSMWVSVIEAQKAAL